MKWHGDVILILHIATEGSRDQSIKLDPVQQNIYCIVSHLRIVTYKHIVLLSFFQAGFTHCIFFAAE